MARPPRGRSRRRAERRRGWVRALRRVSMLVVLGAAAGVFCRAGWRFVRHHPYFALREVVVSGAHYLDPGELRRASGLVLGMPIWDVDAGRTEARLAANPWIRAVSVRRQLPARVAISVRERRPMAILLGPEPYYVDRFGVPFAELRQADRHDLPYITGLSRRQAAASWGRRVLRTVLARLRTAGRGGWSAAISEVHIDRKAGVTLYPVFPRLPVDVGWGPWIGRLSRLERVLALWRGREAQIASASVRFPGEVVLRLRRGRGNSGKREG